MDNTAQISDKNCIHQFPSFLPHSDGLGRITNAFSGQFLGFKKSFLKGLNDGRISPLLVACLPLGSISKEEWQLSAT